MLLTPDAVRAVMLDGGGVDAMAPGSWWAQMGTIGAEATVEIRDRVAARRSDVMFVDAPVSGSRGPAEHAQLTILAFGPRCGDGGGGAGVLCDRTQDRVA